MNRQLWVALVTIASLGTAVKLGHWTAGTFNKATTDHVATSSPEASTSSETTGNQPLPSLFKRELAEIPIGETTAEIPTSPLASIILANWFAECSPQTFLKRTLTRLDSDRSFEPALRLFFEHWLSEDREAALIAAAKMTSRNRRTLVGTIIWNEILNEMDVERAKRLLSTFGGELPYSTQLPDWAMQEPVSSFKFFTTIPPSNFRTLALSNLAKAWAMSDPIALLQLTDESRRHETGLARDDASRCRSVAARAIVSRDLDAAKALHKTLAHPQQRVIASELADQWGETDPQAALHWILANDRGSFAEYSHVRRIFMHWVEQNLDEAASAVFEVPDGQSQHGAAEVVVRALFNTDPEAAQAWADSLPNGHAKQTAMERIAKWRP